MLLTDINFSGIFKNRVCPYIESPGEGKLLTIYEQLKEALKGKIGDILSIAEIKSILNSTFNTNLTSIILSDYCYNRYNNGILFNKHLFIYIDRSTYRYVGENYAYTGLVFHKPKGAKQEFVVGE